jgi:hypothetical protein
VKVNRKKEALRRLKIKPEQLESSPRITPMFKKAEGGLRAVLNAMRFSAADESIAAFLKKYDAIPAGDRGHVPWEAIALSAKIDLQRLTGAILFAMQAASVNTVKVIALSAHPLIMQKTIEFAQMPGGIKDRNTMHQALGFLPSPKGPTFIGKAVFGPGSSKETEGPVDATVFDGDDDIDELFPAPSDMQEKLVPIRQRLLETS